RFRTPVDDPRDITVLFLLMALGMAAGLGLVPVAAIGAFFVCACLILLRHGRMDPPRSMKVALVAQSREFPGMHVSNIFAAHHIVVEPLEFVQGEQTAVRYRARLRPGTSLGEVSAQLLDGGGAGIASVSWETSKKGL